MFLLIGLPAFESKQDLASIGIWFQEYYIDRTQYYSFTLQKIQAEYKWW